MSANIYFRPIEKNQHDLSVGSASLFWETLEKAFNVNDYDNFILGEDDMKTLLGMNAVYGGEESPYEVIMNAIHKYGQIEIFREF